MRTKIICSIGPKTESEEMIKKLIENSMDIARLNFSHDTYENHGKRIDLIRKWAKKLKKRVKILCDLQGPKIRVQEFEDSPRILKDGQKIILATSVCEKYDRNEVVIEDPHLHSDVSPKDIILIDDGQIELIVNKTNGCKINCTVVNGGDLYPRKGVNLPLTQTTTNSLTEKDKRDLEFIISKKPDWIAISFVQDEEDINKLRSLLKNSKAKIMCKIERAKAISNLSKIIEASDGIMVARGDLGVEIPIERLPAIQKQIINKCNYAGKPVVTATQMLASMTHYPFPSRAEVSDIANAVIDGTDAVMMSNETAVGNYPIESLKMMAKVVAETENYLYNRKNGL